MSGSMSGSRFVPRTPQDVVRLIEAFPLAWIVSAGPDGSAATPLPLLAETGADGGVEALFGHFAKANPHVRLLERAPEAMILFQGPSGYVAPRLVTKPDWGPTWNYAVVRFDVELRFVPEETAASVERLAAALEQDRADPWTVERMGPRLPELMRYIVAFRARVTGQHARFKLGQDEAPEIFDEIVAGLDNRPLADWMTRIVRG